MLSPSSHCVNCLSVEEKARSIFAKLPEEIQDKITSYVNPAVIRLFSQYIASKPAVNGRIQEDITFFSAQDNSSVHKKLYFKYVEKDDVIATAQKICDFMNKNIGVHITPFEYFEAASEKRTPPSMDLLIQLDNKQYDKQCLFERSSFHVEIDEKAPIFIRHLLMQEESISKQNKDTLRKLQRFPSSLSLKEQWLLAIQNSYSRANDLLDYTRLPLFPISEADVTVALDKLSLFELKEALLEVPEAVLTALWKRVAPVAEDLPAVTIEELEEPLLSVSARQLVEALVLRSKATLAGALVREALIEESRQGLLCFPGKLKRVEPRLVILKKPTELALMTATVYAFRKEYALLEILYEHSEIRTHKEYREPLIFYARCGHVEKLKCLLKQQHRSAVLKLALQKAVRRGHAEVVCALLGNDAKQEEKIFKAGDYCEMLYMASEKGHVQVVQTLLQTNVSVAKYDKCFSIAALNGHPAVVLEFLRIGKALCRGKALQRAAVRGHVEVMQLLLKEDISIEDKRWALYVAHFMKQESAVQALQVHREKALQDTAEISSCR